jgi:hypothetical protein
MRQYVCSLSPLLVLHSPTLPVTPQSEIDAAHAAGRQILHVHFVKSNGNGGEAVIRPPCGPESEPAGVNTRPERSSED